MNAVEIQKVLARNIRAHARKKKMSMTRLADFSQIARSNLFRVLRGETSPSLRWIVSVAETLEVETWQLLVPARSDRADSPRKQRA